VQLGDGIAANCVSLAGGENLAKALAHRQKPSLRLASGEFFQGRLCALIKAKANW